jgi:CRP/FNR family transcriptional regulator, polysaccharide utilization system transcription regulator
MPFPDDLHLQSDCFRYLKSSDSVFKYLTVDELNTLTVKATSKTFSKGEVLYHEGGKITGAYFVYSGILKVYKTGFDGKEQIIMFAKPGDIIGYRSVLANELACTTSRALEEARLCFIPAEGLIQIIKNNSSFSLEMMKLACKELGEANQYITDLAQKSVKERLAEILLHLAENFGLDEKNTLKIVLTREELSNIVGTATESVIRLLSEFKQKGLIELRGRKIAIRDEQGLKHISNAFY